MSSQALLRTDYLLSCPSETGKETENETRTRSGTGRETEERGASGTSGQSGKKKCSAGSGPVARGSGTGTRFGSLRGPGRKNGGPGPGTENGGGGREGRVRKGRQIRRVNSILLIYLYRKPDE